MRTSLTWSVRSFASALLAALLLASLTATANAAQPEEYQPNKPTLSIANGSADEGDGFIEFTASIDKPTTRNVNFRLRMTPGTAKPAIDFFLTPRRTYTILRGETTTTIRVRIVDDQRAERNESFTVTPARVRAANFDGESATGIIYDDETNLRGTGVDLNILHINDHHGHLKGEDITLDLPDGSGTAEVEFELGGFGRVAAQVEALETELAPGNVVKVHAGDALSGTLFYTLFGGEADAAVMNEVCFDIFAPGNHEFDGGDAGLASFLDFLNAGGCETAVLAANIDPALGTPLAPESKDDYLAPFTVKQFGNTKVGFIGIDIAQKTQVSSSPLDTTTFADEMETAQFYIDMLSAADVRSIVLVTHYQYENDLALAHGLRGVDAIIGGDSHSLLGDFDQYGLSSAGPYPTLTTDALGNTVCIAQAWQYSYVVGNIELSFDRTGRIRECSGTPHLLLGDVLDDGGLAPEAIQAAVDADPQLTVVTPDESTEAVIATFDEEVAVLEQTVIGQSTEAICAARFPNDGRSLICSNTETPKGGPIQQLVTDAFLARAFRAEIALQNSGGVRIDIDEGDITIAEVYELLPFANTLFEVEMTGAEILTALEQGVGNVLDTGGSDGAFPYGAGIRWDLDENQAAGSRFSNVEVQPKGTATWVPIDTAATYVVVANSFMATGGDGYQAIADAVADGRGTDTLLDYAQSFIDYIEQDAGGTISAPTEFSLQNYTPET